MIFRVCQDNLVNFSGSILNFDNSQPNEPILLVTVVVGLGHNNENSSGYAGIVDENESPRK
jgi:hypothetical protein